MAKRNPKRILIIKYSHFEKGNAKTWLEYVIVSQSKYIYILFWGLVLARCVFCSHPKRKQRENADGENEEKIWKIYYLFPCDRTNEISNRQFVWMPMEFWLAFVFIDFDGFSAVSVHGIPSLFTIFVVCVSFFFFLLSRFTDKFLLALS